MGSKAKRDDGGGGRGKAKEKIGDRADMQLTKGLSVLEELLSPGFW